MMGKDYAYPSLAPSKDPADYPLFKGGISRGVWRILTQRLTANGRWLAAATVVLLSYSGTSSLTLQSFVPAVYVIAIWLLAILFMILNRPRVRLQARLPSIVRRGDDCTIDVSLRADGNRPGQDLIVLAHNLPTAIDMIPSDGVALPPLNGKTEQIVRFNLRFWQRGKFVLKGFRVESGFPFGILRARQVFPMAEPVLVHPSFVPISRLDLPVSRRFQPGGVAMVSKLGESFEYLGNREYRQGDNVRDIDWRATARLQRPVVREWVEEYMLRVAIVLDTHVPEDASAAARECFEQAVSTAAAVGDYMARQDYLVDLFAAGPNLYHLTAGRSLAYLDQILEILACVESSPAEPLAVIEPPFAELLDRLSVVVCILLDWNDERARFVRSLRESGLAVKLILLRDGPCTLEPTEPITRLEPSMYQGGAAAF